MPELDPSVSIKLSTLAKLVDGYQHALDTLATTQATVATDEAANASLQSNLDGLKAELADLKASQDQPLPDDLSAQIEKLTGTDAPVVAPVAPADDTTPAPDPGSATPPADVTGTNPANVDENGAPVANGPVETHNPFIS